VAMEVEVKVVVAMVAVMVGGEAAEEDMTVMEMLVVGMMAVVVMVVEVRAVVVRELRPSLLS